MKTQEWPKDAIIIQPWGDLGSEDKFIKQRDKYIPALRSYKFNTIIFIPAAAHNDISRNKYTKKDFKEAVTDYQRKGFKVIIYACHIHIGHDPAWHRLVKEHPDWLMVNEDGKPLPLFGDLILCPANEDVFQYSLQYTVDLVREYGPDCIMLDNNFFRAPGNKPGCYCPGCQKKFRQYIRDKFTEKQIARRFGVKPRGIRIPKEAERNALYEEWIDWRYETVKDWTRRTTKALKTAKSDLVVTTNSLYSVTGWAGAIEKQFEEQDVVFAESYGPPTAVSAKSRHARTLGKGRPVWHYMKTWKDRSISGKEEMLEPTNIAALMASIIGSGAMPWIVTYAWDILTKTPEGDAVKRYTRFLANHSEYYKDAEYPAELALVASRTTIDHDPEYHRHTGKWYPDVFPGNIPLLIHGHVPFHMLEDWDLEGLNRYKAALLPHPSCIGNRLMAVLTEYVEKGGLLIATECLGEHDDHGRKRKRPALQHLLQGSEKRKGNNIFGKVLSAQYGRGVFAFLKQDVGRRYRGTWRREYIETIRDILGARIRKPLMQVENCPTFVEIHPAIQRVDGCTRYLFHVMNYGETGTISDIRIRFRLSKGAAPRTCHVISPDRSGTRKIPLRKEQDYFEFVVPKVQAYTLVVAE